MRITLTPTWIMPLTPTWHHAADPHTQPLTQLTLSSSLNLNT